MYKGDYMQQLFKLLSTLLNIYSFIIFIRIILSWFTLRGNTYGFSQTSIITYIYKITDPYLNWFRRFKFLQIGFLDFSAILAIMVLYFVSNIMRIIGNTGTITLTMIILLLLSSLWSLASSIMFILTIILIVRIIFIQLNKYSQIFYNLDGYIEPSVRKFSNLITKKFTTYKVNLIILTIALVLAQIIGKILLSYIFIAIQALG